MSGYKLADGTLSSDYKIGDFFVLNFIHDTLPDTSKVGDVVKFYRDDGSKRPIFEIGEATYYIHWCDLKKKFTKSDLKDGMRAVYREGSERLLIGDTLYCYEKINLSFGFAAMLQDFSDTLEFKGGKNCDIMKVIDRDNTVLFERVEAPAKSAQEIEMDKLQKQIAELSAQADKLKASMK